jgi:hypothetical protein
MLDSREWIPHIVTLIIGGFLGWYTADVYYVRSANDLHSFSKSALTQSQEQTRHVEEQYRNLEAQYGRLEQQYEHVDGLMQNALSTHVIYARRNAQGQIISLLPSPPRNFQVH